TVLQKKLNNDFLPPALLAPELPEHVGRAIRRALDALPAERPASCAEFADLLTVATPAAAGVAPPEGKPGAISEGDPTNRRGALRYPSSVEAACRPLLGGGTRWPAEVQDVSITGLRLRLGRRFEPGTLLHVEPTPAAPRVSSSLLVRACWVKAAGP